MTVGLSVDAHAGVDHRSGFGAAVTLWFFSRTLMVTSFLMPAEHANFADIGSYFGWSHLAWVDHLLPGRDYAWEYPPGALPFVLLPVGNGGAATYFVTFLTQMLVLDLGMLALLHVVGLRRGSRAGVHLWLLALPLLGPVVLTRYDLAPTLLAVLGVTVAVVLPLVAGALLALAASVKVWPVVVLCTVLPAHRQRGHLLAGTSAMGVLLLATSAATGVLPAASSTLHNQLARGSQVESLAALPFLWLRALGRGSALTYRHGAWEVSGAGTAVVAGLLGAGALAALCALWITVFHQRRDGRQVDLAVVAASAVGIALLGNKVFSPQYLLWVLGLICLAACRVGSVPPRILPVTVLTVVTTHLTYPLLYNRLLAGEVLPLLILTVRDCLLIALVVLLVRPHSFTSGGPA